MEYGVLLEISSVECVHKNRQSLRIANPSIYLIDKGCMLHESGYNVHCKSFLDYGERPCTISHAALSMVSYKRLSIMDIATSITKLRTSRLYTRKSLAEKAGINLRHLIAVEDGREEASQEDIGAISRVFRVRPEDWLS